MASASPWRSAVAARSRPSPSGTTPAASARSPATTSASSRRSSGPSPRSTAPASPTSRALPTQRPRGRSASLTLHRSVRPHSSAMPAIRRAVARASSASPTRPPEPAFTSTWTAPAPPATAELITEAATSPPEVAVPVASRRSRRRRSPGTRRGSWATTAMPTSRTCRTKPARLRSERKPGIASSLSTAPPVWARLRPPRLATRTPSDAARGAATSGVVSPTPPVDCGSPVGPSERQLQAVAGGDQGARQGPGLLGARGRAGRPPSPRPP